jgi:ribonucleoside-diphosphate reductase beta chain
MGVDAQTELRDPQALYHQWEHNQWNPFAIDLSVDAEQWAALGDEDRSLVHWGLSSLMVGEERITTKFSGLVMAYDSEEEETFLTTQQVDEARHMQFYKRVQDEVIADPATIAEHVARSRKELGPAFGVIFDEVLVQAHERLAANPRDREGKIEFVTTYHLVIESTLGLTAFNFITRYLERAGLLAGFREGYGQIHHDEQRHIAYGVWFLREAVKGDPAAADVVRGALRRLLPPVAEALSPPGEGETDWATLGTTAEEVREFAIGGLSRRLNIVGVPLESL